MANLNDVKVGDRVWVGKRNHRGTGLDRRDGMITVTRVTPKRFNGAHSFQNWLKERGRPYGVGSLWALSIATPEEIEEWEARQAQAKRDAENAEAERERLYQKQRARMNKLGIFLIAADLRVGLPTTNIINFEFKGHQYRVSEVED